jgi:drug/metabolite transporter (DMT)-like permease
VLVGLSLFGLLLNQSAYQAGDLTMSLPIMTALEPIVAILIGQLLFGEHIGSSALAVAGVVIGLVVMSVGVIELGRLGVPAGAAPED